MKARATSLLLVFCSLSAVAASVIIPNLKYFKNPTGAVATFSTQGAIGQDNAFFQPLGTNGRSCATCHQADQAFGLSVSGVREVYERTGGSDPLFAAVDGANCPTDTGTDRKVHSLLLEQGLIRVGITLPAKPQFTIRVVHDPYGCAMTTDGVTGRPVISVYRRPLPTANLRYLSTVMFDGRETIVPLNDAKTFTDNLNADLTHQASSAITTHAQASVNPTDAQLAEIVKFEMGLSTAQIMSDGAGPLFRHGARGGPSALAQQAYYPGTNDSLGSDPSGGKFNSSAFTLYSAWEKGNYRSGDADGSRGEDRDSDRKEMREKIAAGEKLFNTAPAIITDVRGLNDNPALKSPTSIVGTCTTCHDTPNVGNHSFPLPLDIAVSRQAGYERSSGIINGLKKLSVADLPVYEIRDCFDPKDPGRPVVFYTSDPGKALISGQCSDVNRVKGPILRGLAARAPYFHNGSAANLTELVEFYNERFQMNFTSKEKEELIAFLNSL